MTVTQQQCLLVYLGYDTGGVDGIWGPKSIGATKAVQSAYGLISTGIFDEALEARIRESIGAGTEIYAPGKNAGMSDCNSESWWKYIRHFTKPEFRCPCGKCGGFPAEPQEALVLAMDDMREAFGSPVIVVPPDGHSDGSGVRCAAYNATLSGSVSNSRHLQGKAADFTAPGVPATTIEAYLTKIKNSGTIRYWYKITAGSYHMDVL